eukprot:scaffold206200_cov26-Tisochrysis_lutea.AAC.3
MPLVRGVCKSSSEPPALAPFTSAPAFARFSWCAPSFPAVDALIPGLFPVSLSSSSSEPDDSSDSSSDESSPEELLFCEADASWASLSAAADVRSASVPDPGLPSCASALAAPPSSTAMARDSPL